ncbi:MAG: hypothetical protein K2N33_01930 [Clostridia bacterium]|nr:hypothetical protein [Clostridia bacterium]
MNKFEIGGEEYSITLTQFTEEVAAALKHYFICDVNAQKNSVNVSFPNGQRFLISVAEVVQVN